MQNQNTSQNTSENTSENTPQNMDANNHSHASSNSHIKLDEQSPALTATQMSKTQELSHIIISALEDVKGKEIVVLDTARKTKLFDQVIVCSAASFVQGRALAHHVIDKVKEAGFSARNPEGLESAEWVLVDCIDIVVHIMLPPIRAYYRLEEIWA